MSGLTPRRAVRSDATIDGLRGLAMLAIVTTHYLPTEFFAFNVARPVSAIMLVVTGYFLATVMLREGVLDGATVRARLGGIVSLLALRHVRVWPVLVIVVLFYVVLGVVDGGELTTQIVRTWPLYLGYMGNVAKMLHEGQTFPAHFWLISAQEQWIALTLAAAAVLGAARLPRYLWWMVAVGIGYRIVACALLMPDHPAVATETPFAVADALALGMLARFAVERLQSRAQLVRLAWAAAAASLLAFSMLPNTPASYFGIVPLTTALVGCAVVVTLTDPMRAPRLARSVLGHPVFVVLGQMSLSLFLIHPLVNTLIYLGYGATTGAVMPWWALAVVGPPLSLLAGFAFFRMIEVPIRQMRRSAARESHRGATAAVPA